MKRILNAVVRGLALGAVLLTVMSARVVWSSRVEWKEAESKFAAGDRAGAVDHWGRAARLYAPGNPYSTSARARLAEVAEGMDRRGNTALALSAWRELRGSILATRSFYTPARPLLDKANQSIARLAAASENPALDPGGTFESRLRWHEERLSRDDAPAVAWSILALLGLFAWVGAAIGFIYRAFDRQDRLIARPAFFWSIGVAAGLALFFLGLALA